ncbi:hypothetical protein [Neobacillus niacini]|uniref:hypothetical protein n=1 Tax=Neobacillus niacini TaxID=86668 RepID=UPI001C8E4D5B|nr:hypothetical protein [Neobacillus niacini]MBY0144256.1 hypothetical protein [Neobacillus niacini]
MNITTLQTGKIVIKNDEELLSKIEGQSLEGVDISDFRVSADDLAKLFNLAQSTRYTYVKEDGVENPQVIKTHDNVKRYKVLKAAYLEKFSK